MLFGSSRKKSPTIAECSIPAYCVKTIGCRHILIGGGGGGVKTGVRNELQLFLLTYDQLDKLKRNGPKDTKLKALLAANIETDIYANMNMDLILLSSPDSGLYLIAVGQDQFCALYETTGFRLNELGDGVDSDSQESRKISARLAFNFREVGRVITDKKSTGPYQKCVRLFRAPTNDTSEIRIRMVTAGDDGYFRIWTCAKILEATTLNKRSSRGETSQNFKNSIIDQIEPDVEVLAGTGGIDQLDVSRCGQVLATVLPKDTVIWDLASGERLATLPVEKAPITSAFKVRSLRFTNKSERNAIFIAAHNQRVRTSKETSYISVWAYLKEQKQCRLILAKKACKESISCLEVSECGSFAAIGTMSGSVAVFDTDRLDQLFFASETHDSFVTDIEFLQQRSYDYPNVGRISSSMNGNGDAKTFLPGVCATARAAIVSLSVDQTIQVHQVPYPKRPSFTLSLLKIAIGSVLIYFLLWLILID